MQARGKILLVEDDVSIRSMVGTLLADEFELAEASNGVLALVQAWDHRPDVIVLDLEMPAMGGAEAAPYLRVLSPTSRIVAFSSSLTSTPIWADTFVEKSDPIGLVEVIRELTSSGADSSKRGSLLLRPAS